MAENAVITGATGMIGRALASDLIANGYHVYVIIRPGSPRGADIVTTRDMTVIPGDLADLRTAAARIPVPCDAFFHLGWAGTVGPARDDVSVQEANIRYTLDAVDIAESLGCSVFLGTGSQAEYGRAEGDLAPDMPTYPENGYGVAKLCASRFSRIRAAQLGMRHVWTRILSVYGPYDGPQTMVMHAINMLLAGRRPSFTPCGQFWDYLFCEDAARALRLSAEKGHDGSVYCIGSGQARPLADYVKAIGDCIDPGLPLGIGDHPYAKNQVMRLRADISSLQRDTGFNPRIGFEEGIARTISWCREQNRETGAK
jgi:UDP-glucose 4-epimerase